MGIAAVILTAASAACLLGAGYLAGRWTRQPWLIALVAAAWLSPFLFGFAVRSVIDAAQDGRIDIGGSPAEIVGLLAAAQGLVFSVLVGALLLLAARRSR